MLRSLVIVSVLLSISTLVLKAQCTIDVVTNATDVTCENAMDGSAVAAALTGNPPYTFAWSNGATTEDISELGSGAYQITITDADGCTGVQTTVVNSPLPLTIEVVEDTLGSQITVTAIAGGGTPPYSYQWSTGAFGNTTDIALGDFYDLTVVDANGCAALLDSGINNLFAVISGKVFHDQNENGIQDAGEIGLANRMISATGWWTWSDSNGDFSFILPTGSYEVSLESDWNGFNLTTIGSYYVEAATGDSTYGPFNFGLVGPTQNFAIEMMYWSAVVPGFYTTNLIYATNYSATPTNATMLFVPDSSLSFQSAYPMPDAINGDTIIWYVDSLNIGDYYYVTVSLLASDTLQIGTIVEDIGLIIPMSGDGDTTDNQSIIQQTVVGSFDPNDKAVSPVGQGPDGDVNPDHVKTLNYTIRFQNTGTFYATNVTLVDTLSPNLDWNSLRLLNASHEYNAQFDASTGVLKWIFTNIMLPDSNTNEPESHGFVQFEIDLDSNLANLTTTENFADIYFDFNDPVRTNTVKTTIVEGLAAHQAVSDHNVTVYPNPASDQIHWSSKTSLGNPTFVEVRNVLGSNVALISFDANGHASLKHNALPAGVYTYRVVSGERLSAQGKFVFE